MAFPLQFRQHAFRRVQIKRHWETLILCPTAIFDWFGWMFGRIILLQVPSMGKYKPPEKSDPGLEPLIFTRSSGWLTEKQPYHHILHWTAGTFLSMQSYVLISVQQKYSICSSSDTCFKLRCFSVWVSLRKNLFNILYHCYKRLHLIVDTWQHLTSVRGSCILATCFLLTAYVVLKIHYHIYSSQQPFCVDICLSFLLWLRMSKGLDSREAGV